MDWTAWGGLPQVASTVASAKYKWSLELSENDSLNQSKRESGPARRNLPRDKSPRMVPDNMKFQTSFNVPFLQSSAIIQAFPCNPGQDYGKFDPNEEPVQLGFQGSGFASIPKYGSMAGHSSMPTQAYGSMPSQPYRPHSALPYAYAKNGSMAEHSSMFSQAHGVTHGSMSSRPHTANPYASYGISSMVVGNTNSHTEGANLEWLQEEMEDLAEAVQEIADAEASGVQLDSRFLEHHRKRVDGLLKQIDLKESQYEQSRGILERRASDADEQFLPDQMRTVELLYEEDDTYGRQQYIGQLRNGLRHGLGVMRWSDGAKFEGDWKDDKPSGFGVEFYDNDSSYAGQFLNDERHGLGSFRTKTGDIWSGHWEFGHRHGPGFVDSKETRRFSYFDQGAEQDAHFEHVSIEALSSLLDDTMRAATNSAGLARMLAANFAASRGTEGESRLDEGSLPFEEGSGPSPILQIVSPTEQVEEPLNPPTRHAAGTPGGQTWLELQWEALQALGREARRLDKLFSASGESDDLPAASSEAGAEEQAAGGGLAAGQPSNAEEQPAGQKSAGPAGVEEQEQAEAGEAAVAAPEAEVQAGAEEPLGAAGVAEGEAANPDGSSLGIDPARTASTIDLVDGQLCHVEGTGARRTAEERRRSLMICTDDDAHATPPPLPPPESEGRGSAPADSGARHPEVADSEDLGAESDPNHAATAPDGGAQPPAVAAERSAGSVVLEDGQVMEGMVPWTRPPIPDDL